MCIARFLIPRLVALAAVLCTAASAAVSRADTRVSARADVEVKVDVGRPPPFDGWCIKPSCSGPSLAAAFTRPPPLLTPSTDYGLIEERLHRAVAAALEGAAASTNAAPSLPEPLVDFARTAAAAILGDQGSLERLGGLGAAALRLGLVSALDGAMRGDSQCAGVDRINAIYEGLALTASFAPLHFPASSGSPPQTGSGSGPKPRQVVAGCAETAQRVALGVDAAVLRAVVSEDMLRGLDAAVQAVSEVRARCGALTSAPKGLVDLARAAELVVRASRIDATAESLRDWRAHAATPSAGPAADRADASAGAGTGERNPLDGSASPNEPPKASVDGGAGEGATEGGERSCQDALSALEGIDPAILEAWGARGLGAVSLDSVAAALRAPALACDSPEACALAGRALSIGVRFAVGQASDVDLGAILQDLAQWLTRVAAIPASSPILSDAVAALGQAVVVHEGTPTVDPGVVAALLRGKYDVDAAGVAVLRTLIGPTPWVFEVNGGIPNVDFARGKVVADLTFGYQVKAVGVVGRGAIDTYDTSTSTLLSDYSHYHGGLEGWWRVGPPAGLQFELRLAGSFDSYDTTTYPGGNLSRFLDFDSRMVRADGLIGLRYGGPTNMLAAELRAGGGFQYEDPDTTGFSGMAPLFKSEANASAHGTAHALVRVRAVPHILGFRLRGDGEYFSISRSDLTFNGTTTTVTNEARSQLELHGRLFTDFDVASLAGFVPSAWGGIDVLNDSGGAANDALVALVLGIGITLRVW